MKILLSESQIIHLLKESYGDDPYINYLLDKISARGLSTLSDKERGDLDKMSRGENVDMKLPSKASNSVYDNEDNDVKFGDDEDDIDYDSLEAFQMFLEEAPQRYSFVMGGKTWTFSVEQIDVESFPTFIVTDGITTFYVSPFERGGKFSIENAKGDKVSFSLNSIPKTQEEMKSFVKLFFNGGGLHSMLTKIKG